MTQHTARHRVHDSGRVDAHALGSQGSSAIGTHRRSADYRSRDQSGTVNGAWSRSPPGYAGSAGRGVRRPLRGRGRGWRRGWPGALRPRHAAGVRGRRPGPTNGDRPRLRREGCGRSRRVAVRHRRRSGPRGSPRAPAPSSRWCGRGCRQPAWDRSRAALALCAVRSRPVPPTGPPLRPRRRSGPGGWGRARRACGGRRRRRGRSSSRLTSGLRLGSSRAVARMRAPGEAQLQKRRQATAQRGNGDLPRHNTEPEATLHALEESDQAAAGADAIESAVADELHDLRMRLDHSGAEPHCGLPTQGGDTAGERLADGGFGSRQPLGHQRQLAERVDPFDLQAFGFGERLRQLRGGIPRHQEDRRTERPVGGEHDVADTGDVAH